MTDAAKMMRFDKKGIPLTIVGLSQAGKSSFVKRIMTGKFEETRPTMGLQFETTEIGDARFDIFDLGGHESYRKTLWESYVKLAYGIIFIFDSADTSSVEEAKKEFWRVIDLKDNRDEFLILFLCNKSDLKDSQSLESVINNLSLYNLAEKENASYQFFKTSMKTGENIDNALNWLKNNTAKLAAKRKIDPLMFMIADIDGFPLLEIDKIGLDEDPSLLAGFLAAIESFSQRLFGKTGMLQYMVSGDFKYIIKTDDQYIYSMIISKDESQLEARREIEVLNELVKPMKDYSLLESIVVQALNIDLSEYVMRKGFR
ncbi:MAG: GTP-binding protein [Candidatus Heimdallarchaeota archaeon]|nr:GTP-binding protein [Candidatus Heimdallarchaeota archaeon]